MRGRRSRRRRTWWYRWRCQARPRGRGESPTRFRAPPLYGTSRQQTRLRCVRRTVRASASPLPPTSAPARGACVRAAADINCGARPRCGPCQCPYLSLAGSALPHVSVVPLWASTDRATVRGCAAAAPAAGYACDVLLFGPRNDRRRDFEEALTGALLLLAAATAATATVIPRNFDHPPPARPPPPPPPLSLPPNFARAMDESQSPPLTRPHLSSLAAQLVGCACGCSTSTTRWNRRQPSRQRG